MVDNSVKTLLNLIDAAEHNLSATSHDQDAAVPRLQEYKLEARGIRDMLSVPLQPSYIDPCRDSGDVIDAEASAYSAAQERAFSALRSPSGPNSVLQNAQGLSKDAQNRLASHEGIQEDLTDQMVSLASKLKEQAQAQAHALHHRDALLDSASQGLLASVQGVQAVVKDTKQAVKRTRRSMFFSFFVLLTVAAVFLAIASAGVYGFINVTAVTKMFVPYKTVASQWASKKLREARQRPRRAAPVSQPPIDERAANAISDLEVDLTLEASGDVITESVVADNDEGESVQGRQGLGAPAAGEAFQLTEHDDAATVNTPEASEAEYNIFTADTTTKEASDAPDAQESVYMVKEDAGARPRDDVDADAEEVGTKYEPHLNNGDTEDGDVDTAPVSDAWAADDESNSPWSDFDGASAHPQDAAGRADSSEPSSEADGSAGHEIPAPHSVVEAPLHEAQEADATLPDSRDKVASHLHSEVSEDGSEQQDTDPVADAAAEVPAAAAGPGKGSTDGEPQTSEPAVPLAAPPDASPDAQPSESPDVASKWEADMTVAEEPDAQLSVGTDAELHAPSHVDAVQPPEAAPDAAQSATLGGHPAAAPSVSSDEELSASTEAASTVASELAPSGAPADPEESGDPVEPDPDPVADAGTPPDAAPPDGSVPALDEGGAVYGSTAAEEAAPSADASSGGASGAADATTPQDVNEPAGAPGEAPDANDGTVGASAGKDSHRDGDVHHGAPDSDEQASTAGAEDAQPAEAHGNAGMHTQPDDQRAAEVDEDKYYDEPEQKDTHGTEAEADDEDEYYDPPVIPGEDPGQETGGDKAKGGGQDEEEYEEEYEDEEEDEYEDDDVDGDKDNADADSDEGADAGDGQEHEDDDTEDCSISGSCSPDDSDVDPRYAREVQKAREWAETADVGIGGGGAAEGSDGMDADASEDARAADSPDGTAQQDFGGRDEL